MGEKKVIKTQSFKITKTQIMPDSLNSLQLILVLLKISTSRSVISKLVILASFTTTIQNLINFFESFFFLHAMEAILYWQVFKSLIEFLNTFMCFQEKIEMIHQL